MKLSPIVLRLRSANLTYFGDNIAGVAELGLAKDDTLNNETLYVLQLTEYAQNNQLESDVSQKVFESFGVVVALRNDITRLDKTGIKAFDRIYEIRRELFASLVGYELPDTEDEDGFYPEGPIYYKGGILLDVNRAWLWYQFEFEYPARLIRTYQVTDEITVDDLDTISAQYVLTPNAQIPLKSADALPDAITNSDLDQIVDLTENILAGSFDRGFDLGFDLYKGV